MRPACFLDDSGRVIVCPDPGGIYIYGDETNAELRDYDGRTICRLGEPISSAATEIEDATSDDRNASNCVAVRLQELANNGKRERDCQTYFDAPGKHSEANHSYGHDVLGLIIFAMASIRADGLCCKESGCSCRLPDIVIGPACPYSDCEAAYDDGTGRIKPGPPLKH